MENLLNEISKSSQESINAGIATLTGQLNELKKNPNVSEDDFIKVEKNHLMLINEMKSQIKSIDEMKSNLKSFKL